MSKQDLLKKKITEMLLGDPTAGVYSMYVATIAVEHQR